MRYSGKEKRKMRTVLSVCMAAALSMAASLAVALLLLSSDGSRKLTGNQGAVPASVKKESAPQEAAGDNDARKVMVAWQPSHQDDTGDASWHEYKICGDIVDGACAFDATVRNVKCWDTTHGLTGTNNYRPAPTNTVAFDTEVQAANAAGADYFIAIHNDGGAPSGILGECMPGDSLSRQYLDMFMKELCSLTGMPTRGITEVRLYSLEPERNSCPCRFLLEIGDNTRDRALLESPSFREKVAEGLAATASRLPRQR